MTTTVRTCPTPAKSRYATREAAESAAHRNFLRVGGIHLRPYECDCTWWHLTKNNGQQLTAAAGDVATSAEDLLRMSTEEFAEITRADVLGRATPAAAAALRNSKVLDRWAEALKVMHINVMTQRQRRSGDRSPEHRELTRRIGIYEQALSNRRSEAKDLRRARVRPKKEHRPDDRPLTAAQIRAQAGEAAIQRLIEAHQAEFTRLYVAECERLEVDLPARVQRWVDEHEKEQM